MSVSIVNSGTISLPVFSIISSTNASPISVNVSSHGMSTGDTVFIRNHATNTNANGEWIVTVTDANNFTLNGSTGNGVGGATGTASPMKVIQDITDQAVFDFLMDRTGQLDGDQLMFRVYEIVKSSGSRILSAEDGFSDAPVNPDDYLIKDIPRGTGLTDSGSIRYAGAQLMGATRSYDWSVKKYA